MLWDNKSIVMGFLLNSDYYEEIDKDKTIEIFRFERESLYNYIKRI